MEEEVAGGAIPRENEMRFFLAPRKGREHEDHVVAKPYVVNAHVANIWPLRRPGTSAWKVCRVKNAIEIGMREYVELGESVIAVAGQKTRS